MKTYIEEGGRKRFYAYIYEEDLNFLKKRACTVRGKILLRVNRQQIQKKEEEGIYITDNRSK